MGCSRSSIEIPSDRSWVAFRLREGARWHDGRPVSVDDVIWSFNTLIEKGSPLFGFYWAGVDKVEKAGERRVKFSFKPGDNRELPLILGQLPVFPKHYWENRSFGETTLEPPLGSGPYEIASFEPGRHVSYRRRADYWGADLPVNRGHNNFDTIRYEYYRDMDVAIEALKADAYDIRIENSGSKWATAYDVPDVHEGRLRKELIPHQRNRGHPGLRVQPAAPVVSRSTRSRGAGLCVRLRVDEQESLLRAIRADPQLLRELGTRCPRPAEPGRTRDPGAAAGPDSRRGLHERVSTAKDGRLGQDPQQPPSCDRVARGGGLEDRRRASSSMSRPASRWPSRSYAARLRAWSGLRFHSRRIWSALGSRPPCAR